MKVKNLIPRYTDNKQTVVIKAMFGDGQLPPIGTRYMLENKMNGKKVVINMGFEVGPKSPSYLGGCTPEVHWWLVANNQTTLVLTYCEDQSVKCGPVL